MAEDVVVEGSPRAVADHGLPVPDALIQECAQRLDDTTEEQQHAVVTYAFVAGLKSDDVYDPESIAYGAIRAIEFSAQWAWGTRRWRPWRAIGKQKPKPKK